MEHPSNSPDRPFPPPRRVFSAPVRRSSSTRDVPETSSLVETLYMHHDIRIISFTTSTRVEQRTTEASREEAGTLPWSSQLERTIAVGTLKIYRAPGSVAFLSCGSVLQPILRKSQCWCIDENNSIFVLQVRRPNYWRIELPKVDIGSQARVGDLREVLDTLLQFEKTWCPFQRSFFIEVQEEIKPTTKKPWTPVSVSTTTPSSRLEDPQPSKLTDGVENTPKSTDSSHASEVLQIASEETGWHHTPSGVLRNEEGRHTPKPHEDLPPPNYVVVRSSPQSQQVPHGNDPGRTTHVVQENSTSVAEIVNDIDSRYPRDTSSVSTATAILSQPAVPETVATSPRTRGSNFGPVSGGQPLRLGLHEVSPVSANAQLDGQEASGFSRRSTLPAAFPKVVHSEPTAQAEADSHQDSLSIRSRSSSRTSRAPEGPSQSPGLSAPPSPTSSHYDQRLHGRNINPIAPENCRIPGAWVSTFDLSTPHKPEEISAGDRYETLTINSTLQPGVSHSGADITSPSPNFDTNPLSGIRLRSSRVNTGLTFNDTQDERHPRVLNSKLLDRYRHPAMVASRIPMAILTKTCEVLLGPPSHLLALILRVAAKITAGEWRGQVDGVGENGERIPVHWDYSDDELSGVDEESYHAATGRK